MKKLSMDLTKYSGEVSTDKIQNAADFSTPNHKKTKDKANILTKTLTLDRHKSDNKNKNSPALHLSMDCS